jgi:ribosomal protein S18 acetylase RimI-like enzyme
MKTIEIRRVDYNAPPQAQALVALLKVYALDPLGGGEALPSSVGDALCVELAKYPHASSFIAWTTGADREQPIGLINCFETLSTFKAKPLINIHDIVVHPDFRGRGIGKALIEHVQAVAIQRGCCKLTLEVLSNNRAAMGLYRHLGFAPYELDSQHGQALFFQKWL